MNLVNMVLKEWNLVWPRMLIVGPNAIPDRGVVSRHGVNHSIILLPHAKYLRKCHSMKVKYVIILCSFVWVCIHTIVPVY